MKIGEIGAYADAVIGVNNGDFTVDLLIDVHAPAYNHRIGPPFPPDSPYNVGSDGFPLQFPPRMGVDNRAELWRLCASSPYTFCTRVMPEWTDGEIVANLTSAMMRA